MLKDLDLPSIIKNNQMEKVNEWLKEKIHKYGSSKTPKEIIKEVTGEDFDAKYYIKYLKEKYSELYL